MPLHFLRGSDEAGGFGGAAYGLTDGGFAKMTSPRGSVRLRVRVCETAQRGTVFCSFSFNEVPVNFLTGSGFDPVTKTPELKISVVKLEPV